MMGMPKVVGQIWISHCVRCPHCDETMYDDLDREWWDVHGVHGLPDEEQYWSEHELTCKECGKPFIVDGFEY